MFIALALAVASHGTRAAPPTPVIVELFTSEGCIDCPPADELLGTLIAAQPVAGAEIIALGEHVDYWDRLGWKDRFSSAALTNRQRLYQTRFAGESIYTPQMVVDGRAGFVGSDAVAARKALERTLTAPHGIVKVTLDRGATCPEPCRGESPAPQVGLSLSVTGLPPIARGDRADILVAVTESGLATDVTRGENHGKVLRHAPVVRYLATIGQIAADGSGGSARADIPIDAAWQRDRLTLVAFVQELRGRTILAAASVSLKNARP